MSIKTTSFNPMDFLKADDEIAAYLTEAYRDDDPAVFIKLSMAKFNRNGTLCIAC